MIIGYAQRKYGIGAIAKDCVNASTKERFYGKE